MDILWLGSLGSLFLIQFAGLILPGADFIIVMRTALRHNKISALKVTAGISTGVCIYATTIVFFIGKINMYFNGVIHWINLFGAAYLMYMAISCLKKHAPDKNATEIKKYSEKFFYLNGLFCNLSNPKVIIFFISLLPTFVSRSDNIYFHLAIIAVTGLSSLLWFGFISIAIGNKHIRNNVESCIPAIEKVFAVFLIGISCLLLFEFFS